MKLLLLFCLFVGASQVLSQNFPFSIPTKNFTAIWDNSNPSVQYFVITPTKTQIKAIEIHLAELREVHYTSDLESFDGDIIKIAAAVKAGFQMQNESFSRSENDFTSFSIEESIRYGIGFNKTLENGANFTVFYTISTEDENISIPHTGNKCAVTSFCTCQDYQLLHQNASLKFSVAISNWPWKPINPLRPFRKLMLVIEGIGNLTVDYYLDPNFNNSALLDQSICGIGTTVLNLTGGDILAKFSMFQNAISDSDVVPLITSVSRDETTFVTGGLKVPLRIMFPEFVEDTFYDPDMSILFNGKAASDGDDVGADGVDDGNGGSSNDDNIGIAVGVSIGVAVFILIVIVVVIIVVVLIKKSTSHITPKSVNV